MLYFLLNSAVFAVTGAGTSFLIGSLVKSKDAIPAVSNIVTIGISFISGCLYAGFDRNGSLKIGKLYGILVCRGNNIIAGLSSLPSKAGACFQRHDTIGICRSILRHCIGNIKKETI